jgi:Domain of unknown function (DUF4160)
MPAILRERGLSFCIYTEDHPPAHVHVRGDGEVKIDIGATHASVVWNKGLSARYIKIALAVVNRERAILLDAWARIHG